MTLRTHTALTVVIKRPAATFERHPVRCMTHNNNNYSHDNVYGAVIMTKVIARVHPVHLMNVD